MVKGERFNTISHMVGAAMALAGVVVLVVVASENGETRRIVSFSVYGAALFLLYLISTLYHGLPGRARLCDAADFGDRLGASAGDRGRPRDTRSWR